MSNMMAEQLVRATLARFEADRQEAWREILVQLNRRSGNQAASHFNYNPKDGRIRFSDVEDILVKFINHKL